VDPSKTTVGEYLEEWLFAQRARLRPTTLASYEAQLRRYVFPRIGAARLQALRPQDLDQVYSDLLEARLSPRSTRYLHSILRKALADAVRKCDVVRNIADLADPPSSSATKAPEMATWTPAELGRFLEFARDHECGPLFRVLAMTGMRRGEVAGLKWADVDLDGATVTIARQVTAVGRELSFTVPKTDRGRRTIDVDAETVTALQAYRRRQLEQRLALGAGWQDHDLVFPAVDGRPMHPDRIGKTFDRLVRASGLPKIRLHDLRHSHASHLIAAGAHPQALAARLGHATPAFTLARYGHLIPGLGASAARAVADLVDGPARG
jgi:integrase